MSQAQSAGLLDILGPSKTVTVLDRDLEVHGLGGRTIARILAKHEELRAYFTGREVDTIGLFRTALDAIPSIIAAGLQKPFDTETEEMADMIGLDAQLDLVTAILEVTLPRGVDPFLQKFTALGNLVAGQGAAISSKTSPKPSSNSASPA